MRSQTLLRVLFAVLALQLGLGLQVYAASNLVRAPDLDAGRHGSGELAKAPPRAAEVGAEHQGSTELGAGRDGATEFGAAGQDDEHCPMHGSQAHSHPSPVKHPTPLGGSKHHCCSFFGCFCHCTQPAPALSLRAGRAPVGVTLIRTPTDLPGLTLQPAEHFRPPIV